MFYLITISSATIIISLVNFLCGGTYRPAAFFGFLLLTLAGVAAVFIIDGLMAFITRRLPERWFLPESKLFTVGKREKNFYRRTKINTWKKYVPEWGCFTGFHKDKMLSPDDSAYIGRFLLESNYGVAGHIAGALLGYAIVAIPPLHPLTIALPVAIINMILSLLPTMVLRFNTPALRRLYRRNLERERAVRESGRNESVEEIDSPHTS